MEETLILKKFPGGKVYRTNEAMEFRVCVNGSCNTVLSESWKSPLCPCCTFQKNVSKIVSRIR